MLVNLNIVHSSHIHSTLLEEISFPAGGGCLGHFAPQEPFLPTEQHIRIRRMDSASSPLLISSNLIFEIVTSLLHPGPPTKVGVCPPQIDRWDYLVEMEENKEDAGARQEEQQAVEHG